MDQKINFNDLPQVVQSICSKVNNIERILLSRLEESKAETEDKLLNVDEASELLRLEKSTVYSKVSRNELPVMKQGKRLYFSQRELTDYIKSGKKKTIKEINSEAQEYLNR